MSLEVEITTVQPQPVVAVDLVSKMEEISANLEKAYGAVMAYISKAGIRPAGPPFALYRDMNVDGGWNMSAGIPVGAPVTGEGQVKGAALPGGRVAVCWHIGPYETLSKTWEALTDWMKTHGHEPQGPGWEVYMTDPQEEPDPSAWKTQIFWLIE